MRLIVNLLLSCGVYILCRHVANCQAQDEEVYIDHRALCPGNEGNEQDFFVCPSTIGVGKELECVHSSWMCDQDNDCPEGEDELDCEETCGNPKDFPCTDDPTVCIPQTWMCDGDIDCADGSDESRGSCPHFENIIPCPPNQYQCGGSHQCIPLNQVCDNNNDCDSGVDERSCHQEKCDGSCDLDVPCVETVDGPMCVCNQGYYWNDTCVDIDECKYEQFCDHMSMCTNTEGGFSCDCKPGYKKEGNTSCRAIRGNVTSMLEPSLILSNNWDIRQLKMDGNRSEETLLERGKEIRANDFDYYEGKICWISYLGNEGRSEMRCSVNNEPSTSVHLAVLLTTVDSFAIDWVTQNWYFTDPKRFRVSVCSKDGAYCQVVSQEGLDEIKEMSLVLDPRQGFLYYSVYAKDTVKSKLMRVGMDGSDKKVFYNSILIKPVALTIDYVHDYLYWSDIELSTIKRLDLSGDEHSQRIVALGSKFQSIHSIGVFENYLYLSDRNENRVSRIHRYAYGPQETIVDGLSLASSLHVFHQQSQPPVTDPCASMNCPQICALKNNNGTLEAQCLCGAGYDQSETECTEMASDLCAPPPENQMIPAKCSLAICPDGQSFCSDLCLPSSWWCDTKLDCPDGSDEGRHCHYEDCQPTEFTCLSGTCIDIDLYCNGVSDCGPYDNSDEDDCDGKSLCNKDSQFECDEHHCLPRTLVCDGIPDCHDESDEDPTLCVDVNYQHCADAIEYQCRSGECISTSWLCDTDQDCLDGSDESDCDPDKKKCVNVHERVCDSGTRCIPATWFCDGEQDCKDFSDESDENCASANYTCKSPKWACEKSGHHVCLKPSQLCDGINDCDDDLDENRMCNQKLCENSSTNECSHTCYNSPEGFICDCPPAMKLDTDNKTCIDAVPFNQLCDQWGVCGQKCNLDNTTQNGYKCSCLDGFFLEPDNFTCKPLESDAVYVVFSNRHELRRVDIITRDAASLRSGLRNTIALDFCYKKDVAMLFWTDVMEDKIYSGTMSGNTLINVEPIVASGLATTEGVAVDWVAENIYWVESTLDQIEVAKLDGTMRTTLVAGEMTSPRAIVLDPKVGRLFWTDWDGHNPRIESCSMSGDGRTIVYKIDPQDGGGWPNGLTIDYDFKRLYWIDARAKSIHTVDYNGDDYRPILKGHAEMSHPFAMSLFGNHVYWTDWSTNSVVRDKQVVAYHIIAFTPTKKANKFTGENVMIVQRTITQPFGLQVIHPKRQPRLPNPCAINNGNCSDLCLLSFNGTVGCRCPHRKRLDDDMMTCVDDIKFLLYVRKHEIRGVDIDKAHFNVIPVITIPYVDTPTAIDYDHVNQKLYWADKGFQVINVAGFDAGVTTLIDKGLNNVGGFAIDWLSRNLYFSSYDEQTASTASISVATLSGSFRTEIIKEQIKKPTGIALQPLLGFLFFLDIGDEPGQHKIYRARMDGSNMNVIVSGLNKPKSLIVDIDSSMIYFINSANNTIIRCNIDGRYCTQISNPNITSPSSLAVYQDSLFVSADGKIVSLKKDNTTVFEELRDSADNVTAMIMYDVQERQKVSDNKCHTNQSHCSQLCLTTNKDTYVCKCTDGFELDVNNSCKAVKSFLLYAKETEIRGTMFEISSTLEALAPISQIQSASALDFLATQDLIFWVDQKANTISRIKRDLTGREVIVNDGLNSVEGLAVDWVAGHIYWTDAGHSTIEMSKIDGQNRYVIISGDMEKPRSIVVHPSLGYLYWSDWGTVARIERARLDGSDRVQYVYTNITKPWGMTIDYDTNTLYWCDVELQTIERINLLTDERSVLVKNAQSPVSLTVYGGNIYWIDSVLENGSVYRANKATGSEMTLVRAGLKGQVKDIKAYDTSRQKGSNLCHQNNAVCAELCFYVGNNKVQCACSYGKLNEDKKSCDEYKGYIMFSKVTSLEFINLHDSSDPNAPKLPIKNDTYLKNVIGLSYDFKSKRIFYSDIQRGDIQVASFDGQNISVVVDGIGSAEGLAYEKVHDNLYWTSYTNSCISRVNVENAIKNISRKPEVVIQMSKQDNPRAIVVDSCWGLIYWTNWNSEQPRIQRSSLNGTNPEDIILKDILTPNGLTIDHRAKKLYWSDARLDKIERCEMDGTDRFVIIRSIPQHSFSLAIYGDYLFWTDWMLRAVIRVNKYDGTGIIWLRKNLERQPMGIVAIAEDSDNCELHPCHNNSYGCQDKCFTDEKGNPSCQCRYGQIGPDGKTCASSFDCSSVGYLAFPCLNGMCLRFHQSCDGVKDCTDGSDELESICKNRSCPPTMFTCTNRTLGQCIPLSKKCDHNIDCKDGSDETDCDCPPIHWKCKVGPCIPKEYRCDGKGDCYDNSDEVGCDASKSCQQNYISCNSTNDCIPEDRMCDGHHDCAEGTDEDPVKCANMTKDSDCGPMMFQCLDGNCIYENWKCDKDSDCSDGSDEKGCDYKCLDDQFKCVNDSHCISNTWVCDGNPDCIDSSDELMCDKKMCTADQFQCSHGRCIDIKWTCDGEPDCRDGADEGPQANCSVKQCDDTQMQCANYRCVDLEYFCDGDDDCGDRSDEPDGCEANTCSDDEFSCADGDCIDKSLRCDGVYNCPDLSDETDCPTTLPCGGGSMFQCKNKVCINESVTCDGKNDCGDNSDEPDNCNVNECDLLHPCGQICTEKAIGYSCQCRSGYKLRADNITCEDVDECQRDFKCSHFCVNTIGSYYCTCAEHYQLASDKQHCVLTEEEGRPFLLVSNRYYIRKIGFDGQDEVMVQNLTHSVAIDFDYAEQMLYWTDIHSQSSMINRIAMNASSTSQKEVLHSSTVLNPDGIAVDWVGRNLYWCDRNTDTVEVSKLNGLYRKILVNDKTFLREPRALELFPKYGWLFLSDWGDKPHISRISMDGKFKEHIITEDIAWPNALTIDYITEKLFWADANFDYIAMADLDGGNRRTIISKDLHHTFALTTFMDFIFWTDWETNGVYMAQKFSGEQRKQLATMVYRPMDMVVFHKMRQMKLKTNPCDALNCTHLCLLHPVDSKEQVGASCACPEHHKLNEDKRTCTDDCNKSQFLCKKSSKCIPLWYKCDNNTDCEDGTDEPTDCKPYYCDHPGLFQCASATSPAQCIPPIGICDGNPQCPDGSDETYLNNCTEYHCMQHYFKCEADHKCISSLKVCDGHSDCSDGADETDCKKQECLDSHFRCNSTGTCIPYLWQCDGDSDCADDSDELGCEARVCKEDYLKCENSTKCIPRSWECDGEHDCGRGDDSDEKQEICSHVSCDPTYFKCDNAHCIPGRWHCDNDQDCSDGSDERHCPTRSCTEMEFQCLDKKKCILKSARCDGLYDCHDQSDEANCTSVDSCPEGEFQCKTGHMCIPGTWKCDGDEDCIDASDEAECNTQCDSMEFQCLEGSGQTCISEMWMCDGEADCNNGTDEKDCNTSSCSPGKFRCGNGVCIPSHKVCNQRADCADNRDEDPHICEVTCPMNHYSCKNSSKCLGMDQVCDDFYDCPFGDDETADICDKSKWQNCSVTMVNDCDHQCHIIPALGNKRRCSCDSFHRLDEDARSCIEADPCERYGLCDQKCAYDHKQEKPLCYCETGYFELVETHKCVAAGNDSITVVVAEENRVTEQKVNVVIKHSNTTVVYDSHSVKIGSVAVDTSSPSQNDWQMFIVYPGSKKITTRLVNMPYVKTEDKKTEKPDRNTRDVSENTKEELFVSGLHSPQGVAVDWVAKNLYWTDAGSKKIEMKQYSVREGRRRTMVKHRVSKPFAIAVEPNYGKIFWIEHGYPPRIETANLDGSNQSILVLASVLWPTGLAIDYPNQRLYWADMKSHTVETTTLDGKDRNIVRVFDASDPPYLIDVFESKIYVTLYKSRQVVSFPKFFNVSKPDNVTVLRSGSPHIGALFVYQSRKFIIKDETVTNACKSNPCPSSTQMCINNPRSTTTKYSCLCPDGAVYSKVDKKCNFKQCSQDYCKNNGTCVTTSALGAFKCNCPLGFHGKQCESDICKGYCLNGDCLVRTDRPGEATCSCFPGYKGTQCQTSLCDGRCLNGGTCSWNKTASCLCPKGFNGTRCEHYLLTCDHYCENGGQCTESKSGPPICNCTSGFTGLHCEQCLQESTYCYNGGVCTKVTPNSEATCRCQPGWDPKTNCQNRTCDGYCLNKATCSIIRNGIECHCRGGFTGKRCDRGDSVCKPDYCENGGTCDKSNEVEGELKCLCPQGYRGLKCESCDICQNGGTCTTPEGSSNIVCTCPEFFTGMKCEKCLCKNGQCKTDQKGVTTCSCSSPVYSGKYCNKFACDNYCFNDAECIGCHINNITLGQCKECRCQKQTSGDRCQLLDARPQKQTSSKIPMIAIIVPVVVVICIILAVIFLVIIKKHRGRHFRHSRLKDGPKIPNPVYRPQTTEDDEDEDESHQPLDHPYDFDPEKSTNFSNPVYDQCFSTDSRQQLLLKNEESDDEAQPTAKQ